MNNELMLIYERIKGAKLYSAAKGLRVYIPYSLDYSPRRVDVKTYFTIINNRVTLCVTVYSKDYPLNWCKMETERIKAMLHLDFHELINHCECEPEKVELKQRLLDNTVHPVNEVFDRTVKNALNFLCERKVSTLICEEQFQRWFIAIKLAQSRFQSGNIDRLCVFASGDNLESIRTNFNQWWTTDEIPVNFYSIDGISHWNETVYNQLLDTVSENTMLLMDDSHLVKSPDSIRGQRVIQLASRCNYKLLTTPILVTNHLHDMYMQYRLLDEDILSYYSWKDFARKHIIYGGLNGQQIIGYKNLAHLIDATAPYTYAVETQRTINKQLNISTYYCKLTERQLQLYQMLKMDLLRRIETGNFHLYDVFQSLIAMQKIVCGYIPSYAGHASYTHKLDLLKQHATSLPRIIICKYLFEIRLLVKFLKEENCAILSGKLREKREHEWNLFKKKQKKYLISTLAMPQSKLKFMEGSFDVVFFSLSFKLDEYQRCITHLENNTHEGAISVQRFFTTAGIDRYIQQSLDVKSYLASEIKTLFQSKTELKHFIEAL